MIDPLAMEGCPTLLMENGVQRVVRGLPWRYDDGGRVEAGFKGKTGDCVTRAIAIAGKWAYQDIYDELNELAQIERPRKGRSRSTARTGVFKSTIRRYFDYHGWLWTPTMSIGSGTTVHLREGELPMGRLVVSASRHLVAVLDGVAHDIHDPCRGGMRAVYGYWTYQDGDDL